MSTLEAFDPDEQAHNLKDWDQRYDQMTHGDFYGRIDEVQLDQVHIFREYTSQSVRQDCKVWSNGIWLGFSANKKNYRYNSQVIEPETVTIQPGDSQFELFTPENFLINGIVLKQHAIQKMAEIQGLDLSPLLSSSVTKLKPYREQSLKYLLNSFLKNTQEVSPGALQQELLMMNILDSLEIPSSTEIKQLPNSFIRRKSVVDTVKNFIEDNSSDSITISDLCSISNVSRRTLQYSFETVMGISPLQYIKITRLNHVRRDLIQNKGEDTIADISQRRGFWHAGQFSKDYSALFGESPSMTCELSLQPINMLLFIFQYVCEDFSRNKIAKLFSLCDCTF